MYNCVTFQSYRQVRIGQVQPTDCDCLADLLHRHGVNMRYLGRVAQLASDQELEDRVFSISQKQRINAMPIYFLELVEVSQYQSAPSLYSLTKLV